MPADTRNVTKIHVRRETGPLERQHDSNEPGEGPQGVSKDSLESIIASVARERSRAGEALRLLTGKLLRAQEEERRRIARDLHDGLNQQLALLTIELGMLSRKVAKEDPAISVQLLNLRDRAETISNELRQVSHQLHPAALEHLGLVSALRSYCIEFSRQQGIHVWFEIQQEFRLIPFDIAICLYRIVQEALRNVAKHSGAKEAWVKIAKKMDSIQLSIVDNGVGFSYDASRTAVGLGLISIQERVQIVKGQLVITSAVNQGTRVVVQLPITWKEKRDEHEKKHGKAQAAAG
jgi:signal transduction histidine kinase